MSTCLIRAMTRIRTHKSSSASRPSPDHGSPRWSRPGYTVYALNPKSVARYRERHSTSGAKSDAADAHLMAEIVRLDRAAHRTVAGDTVLAEAIKLAARSHQNLVWERTRHMLRLRSALREFYPAALRAFPELDAPDALEVLSKAPDPDAGSRLARRTIAAAHAHAHRRDPAARLHLRSRRLCGQRSLWWPRTRARRSTRAWCA